jgi:hypothetical protein
MNCAIARTTSDVVVVGQQQTESCVKFPSLQRAVAAAAPAPSSLPLPWPAPPSAPPRREPPAAALWQARHACAEVPPAAALPAALPMPSARQSSQCTWRAVSQVVQPALRVRRFLSPARSLATYIVFSARQPARDGSDFFKRVSTHRLAQ